MNRPTQKMIDAANETYARVQENNETTYCNYVLRMRNKLREMDPSLTGLELAIYANAAAITASIEGNSQ